MRCLLLFQHFYVPIIVLQLLLLHATLHSIIGFVPNPKRLLPHQPTFRRQHQLVRGPLQSSTTGLKTGNVTLDDVKVEEEADSKLPVPKNEDLYQFFVRAGYNQEQSIYLSNLFEPRINRTALIDYYNGCRDKSEFYKFLEEHFEVRSTPDKMNIYGALSRYVEKDNKDFGNYFSLDYLNQIRANNSDKSMWFDVPKGFDFVGRKQFFETIIDKIICLNNNDEYLKTWTKPVALVYSSVSGTGKTVALLELKQKLKNEEKIQNMNVNVVLAFLGFNSCLQLVEKEEHHILENSSYSYEQRASQVLARRLAASTIISMNNPDEISRLPHQDMYSKYDIPSVDQSMELLLNKTGATCQNPMCIVVCVDEIQLLNTKIKTSDVPLGKMFLRILRNWQQTWYNKGLRILPVGTGIAIDWTTDSTSGENIAIHGGDSTLISKDNFKNIVEKAINHLQDNGKFDEFFGIGAQKKTVIDIVSSAYWPRVRLVERLKNGNLELLVSSDRDQDGGHWLTWLSSWLRDEDISIEKGPIPGKDNPEGKIVPLFTLSEEENKFCVIPDGFTSSSMINCLKNVLPVTNLYDGLDILQSLKPQRFILKNEQAFEELGFHTVGTAIHVGIYANKAHQRSYSGNQMKRLGPSIWFQEKSAVTHQDNEILEPTILGVVTSLCRKPDYYPFTNSDQSTFYESVINELKKGKPVYIRCGRQTKCDYLFFYHCGKSNNNSELICMIGDAKYSFEGDKQSISTNDQAQLFDALLKVNDAMEAANLQLKAPRLVFVSNKTKLAEPRTNGKDGPSDTAKKFIRSKTSAQKLFTVKLEILNKEKFEFGPYSEILFATRNKT